MSLAEKQNSRANCNNLIVKYDGVNIGILSFDGNTYTFEYDKKERSNNFKLPGIDYPKATSKKLWPYFISRLPEPHTSMFTKLLNLYNLQGEDRSNLMVLLGTVGSKVVTDPFIIQPLDYPAC